MKIASKTKPRLVVYITPAEMKASKARARAAGLRTPHQWAGSVVRIALNSK
jgi:hypothetical protein